MEKDGTGIWPYPSKKAFLARLRDYFEVGENAFTLLNRAAGLKQLNSIDEIFRELVLDDRSAFERATEVASSFDDLTDIHRELKPLESSSAHCNRSPMAGSVIGPCKNSCRINRLSKAFFRSGSPNRGITCGSLKPTGLRRRTNRPNRIRSNAGVSLRSRGVWWINIVRAICE
jgi:hypothetical protein